MRQSAFHKTLPDGSMLAIISDDELVRAFPIPLDFDEIEREAAALYLANPGRSQTMISDQTHLPMPLAVFFFKGHKTDGWQLMMASAEKSLAAKEIQRAVRHWTRWGGA